MAKNIFLASYIGLRKENISVLSDHHSNNSCPKMNNIRVSYSHTIPQISKACKKASNLCFIFGESPAQRRWVTGLRPFSSCLAGLEIFGELCKHSVNTEKWLLESHVMRLSQYALWRTSPRHRDLSGGGETHRVVSVL